MQVKIIRDGQKNILLAVTGEAEGEKFPILLPADVRCSHFKLDQVQFAVEVGLKVRLGWSGDGDFLPLEGRGKLDYSDFDSLSPSGPSQHLYITTVGKGLFHLVLDLTKGAS